MKKILIVVAIISIFSGCRVYKKLEKFDSQKVILSMNTDAILFKAFKNVIENQNDFLSLDTCRITKYEIKPIKGPFFSDHRILIDKKWYSLNLSEASLIILYNGNIYYPEEPHVSAQKIDSLIVKMVLVGLPPCRSR